MTPQQAADYLGLTRAALYQAVARKTIAAHRLGRRLRFARAELDSQILSDGAVE